MVKNMNEFREQAVRGMMQIEVIERSGKTGDDIPPAFRGARQVISANGTGIKIRNPNGTVSSIRFLPAKLMEYKDLVLTIYEPGLRDVTPQEQSLLDECQRLVEESKMAHPEKNAYWVKANFLDGCACPWLAGGVPIRGKQYMPDGKIRDNSIRGKVSVRYKVHLDLVKSNQYLKEKTLQKRMRLLRAGA